MVIRIIDINDNHINVGCIEAIRESKDGMISLIPSNESVTIHVNGVEIMRSERPSFDCILIKSLEVIA